MLKPRLAAAALLVAVMLPAAPASADQPLPAPTNLNATHVSDTAADLAWLRSGLTAQDVVQRLVDGVWQEYTRTSSGFLPLTGLTPGTTYTFRVYVIPIAGIDYATSAPSAPLSFTTLSGPDSQPPAKPAAPTFTNISTTHLTVFWPEATDNVQVTGYHLQQLTGGVWSTVRTVTASGRFQYFGGLTAATAYTFSVIAFDARGNLSPRSEPGTVTTLAYTTTVTCDVQVIVYGQSVLVNVTVLNTTPEPVSGWNIRFTAALSTAIGRPFNATMTRDGTDVTLTPAAYLATLHPGVKATIGFSGTSSSPTDPPPTGFTAAGVPCRPV